MDSLLEIEYPRLVQDKIYHADRSAVKKNNNNKTSSAIAVHTNINNIYRQKCLQSVGDTSI